LISSASSICVNTGPGWKAEVARGLVEDRDAEDVAGQQVGRELHALEVEAERGRERARERGLAEAGQVLDEQVAAGEQGGEGEPHLARLAEHQRIDLGLRFGQGQAQGLG
jgi:hypothetical protein